MNFSAYRRDSIFCLTTQSLTKYWAVSNDEIECFDPSGAGFIGVEQLLQKI